jgi:cytochrome c oxidase cbb3-type subunit III
MRIGCTLLLAMIAIQAGVRAQDVQNGRAVFEGKGACLTCHRVQTTGSRAAPDLTNIGALLTADALRRTLVDPARGMRAAVRSVRAVMRDGTVVIGRRLNEDHYTVQLIDEKEQLRALAKSELREFTVLATPRMPSYQGKLTDAELGDVVAYLLTLK